MKNYVDRGGCYPPRLGANSNIYGVSRSAIFLIFHLFLYMVDDILIDANIM